MSETGRSHRHHPRRHHHHRDDGGRHSKPPSPPSSHEYISDTESLSSRETPPYSHARHGSKAIVIRDPYAVQAPPRAFRRDESESVDYEYTIPRDFDDDARTRRREERERERARERARQQKKEGGMLIAVALFAASIVFCLDWCADDD